MVIQNMEDYNKQVMKGQKKEIRDITLLFVLASGIYFIISYFSKSIFILPDEMYYIEAARAIAHGKGMVYNGIVSPFQKILYSLMISPAFLVGDQTIQMLMISLINAICTASVVFPAYLLAKEAGLVRQKSYLFCFFALIFPETLNCMSFMSEVAFYPVWIWTIYFIYRHIIRDRVNFCESVVLGLFSYILYMTKEVGIIALPAFVGMEFLYFLIRKSSVRRIIQCIVSCVSFVFFFGICKLLLFSQTPGGSYPIFFPEGLSSFAGIIFFIYIILYYLVYIILSLYVFPVFFLPPKGSRDRQFYLFASGSIVALVLVIAFTISMREDYLMASPRLHLRYLAPLTLPYIMIFLKYSNLKVYKIESNKKINVIMLYMYLAVLLLIPVINTHGLMDSKGIEVFRIIGVITERICGERLGLMLYYIGLKLLCLTFIGAGIILLKKKAEKFSKYFILSVVAICILSGIIKVYEIKSLYKADKSIVDQAIALDESMDALDGEKLIVLREITDPLARVVITYNDTDSDFSNDNGVLKEEVCLLAGGIYRSGNLQEYDYLCFDKSIIQDNKEFVDSMCEETVWETELLEIRRVKK